MTLTPLDFELSWQQVEANFADIPAMAEQAWAAAGILMPDDAAEDIRLTMIETLLTQTANAIQIPLHEIYPARHRVRWLTCYDDGPFLRTFASLDSEPPKPLPKQNQ